MPHIYSEVRKLQDQPKVDGGECVRLVQHYTNVGPTSVWRAGERVLDAKFIPPGTVIANFDKKGRWPGNRRETMQRSLSSSGRAARTESLHRSS